MHGDAPPALDDLGLAAALDVLAQSQGALTEVPIVVDTDEEVAGVLLSLAVELVLYRTAQEAITNALRHACPTSIRISLRLQAGMAQLVVIDDGTGFKVPDRFDSLAAQGHLGLVGLDQRVRQAGGQLTVFSILGLGTTLQVDLPLQPVSP